MHLWRRNAYSLDFPVVNAVQVANTGYWNDVFVTKFDPTGSALAYSTFLGGITYDEGYGIAVDAYGSVYVTGMTESPNFPVTLSAAQKIYGGESSGAGDAFVAKISQGGPTTLVLASVSGTYGGTVSLSATLTADGLGIIGRSINFTLNGTSAGSATTDSSGIATINTNLGSISAGSYPSGISASFAGDASYAASSGSAILAVSPAPLQIRANDASKVYGLPLPAFTASYSGFVNGDGPGSIGLPLVFTTPANEASPVATYPINISGPTSQNYVITLVPGTLTITPADTKLSLQSSENPSIYGQTVMLTANVSVESQTHLMPTGNVTFTDGLIVLGTVAAPSGAGTITLSNLAIGQHSISAEFWGHPNFGGSSGNLTQIVNLRATSTTIAVTPPSISEGGNSLVTVTIADSDVGPQSNPTGAVVVSSSGPGDSFTGACSLVPVNGNSATCQIRATSPDNGARTLSASYAGSMIHKPGTGSTPLIVANLPPVMTGIMAPAVPLPINSSVTVTSDFKDPGVLDTHSCRVSWDSGDTEVAGTVSENGGNGTCSATRNFTQAGVYQITVTITDKDGASASGLFQYVVVYDQTAGFVTGSGWIDSPAGAYIADASLTGKASFGFVSKYQKGANVPTGQTEFNFQIANLRFHSDNYEWLVVAGAKAQYKGSGTMNGSGNYKFLLTATDGNLPGGNGVDKFRIKIWESLTGAPVYDNVLNASDDLDTANPQLLSGGSIVIHTN